MHKNIVWIAWGALFFVLGPGLVEPYQLPRAITMLVIAVGCMVLMKKPRQWLIPKSMVWSGLGVVWSLVSVIWSYNSTEAIWSNFLIITPIVSILILSQCWDEVVTLPRIVSWVAWLYLITVVFNLLVTGFAYGWNNQSLYRIQFPGGHKSIIAAVLMGWLAFASHSISMKSVRRLWIVTMSMVIILLQSRAAYLSLLLFALILALHRPEVKRFLRWGWILPVLMALLWLANPGQLRQRLDPVQFWNSPTSQERKVMWEKSLDLVAHKPFIGYGMGQWKIQWPQLGIPASQYYADQDREVVWTRAHNDWLETGVELGIPGMVFLLLFLISIGYQSGRLQPEFRATSRALLGAYLVFSLIDFPRFRLDVQWIYLSWWIWAFRTKRETCFTLDAGKRFRGLFIAIGLFLLGYAGLRYRAEYLVRHLWRARAANRPGEVIATVQKMPEGFLNLDEAAIPVHWYSGMARLASGDQEGAMLDFQIAKNQHPYQHNVWNNLGVLYFQQNLLDSARNCFQRARVIAPTRWEYTRNLVNAMASQGAYSEALTVLDHWMEKNEEWSSLYEKIQASQSR